MSETDSGFERTVDILVVGSGAGGFTAALAAKARGLEPLLIEKADQFGGTSALSGGGVWIPGAPAQVRAGHTIDPEDVVTYLRTLTDGEVSEARIRAFVDNAPRMMDFLEKISPRMQFMWKAGYPDYFPELPGGSSEGSVINIRQIDLRELGADEKSLLSSLAGPPKGMWIAPEELRHFYRLHQSWKGKGVFLKLIGRTLRARLLGERKVAIGQALMARFMLAFREQNLEMWLASPLQSLITDQDGSVIGAVVRHEGVDRRVRTRGGVILASGGFDHSPEMRAKFHPFLESPRSYGATSNTGDGILAGQQVGADVGLMDSAWWYPNVHRAGGSIHALNERMMPAQFIVNSVGKRYINEATPYSEFGRAMMTSDESGADRMESWLITDHRSWNRYVIFGHLPLPKIPFAPAPTGRRMPASWLDSDAVETAGSIEDLAVKIGVPRSRLRETFDRFNELAKQGVDEDFHRGESIYDNYNGDITLPNPNLTPIDEDGPYYAFKLTLADFGTNGGLVTDERARALRADGTPIRGLYATGNTTASVMGYSYAGAGATLSPTMTFGFVAANDIANEVTIAACSAAESVATSE
ncbi:FAD-binding protein (plasmid) [Rhodococcus sp. USK10]|uniref:FAD-dependent oxidoreductase n=1 Tax=Rhodococcus sp. USK10 TaxID=2789739 RepID=UPI001C5DD3D0|nr:FAD-dependent oxidoreductase [Rhodococcus sp. USK10]QYA99774.1 FAD-binding protein [Rhodococcus sp. USK10]